MSRHDNDSLMMQINTFLSEMGSNPEPISGGSNQLKKSLGRITIKINSEILELQPEQRKVKTGVPLSKKGEDLLKAIKEKKDALEDTLKYMEGRAGFIGEEGLEKTFQLVKDNIMTAGKVLESPSEDEVVTESEVINAQQKASETIEEIVAIEVQASEEMMDCARVREVFHLGALI